MCLLASVSLCGTPRGCYGHQLRVPYSSVCVYCSTDPGPRQPDLVKQIDPCIRGLAPAHIAPLSAHRATHTRQSTFSLTQTREGYIIAQMATKRINLAITVNSYTDTNTVLRMNRIAFSVANRKLFGRSLNARRDHYIRGIGNIEGTSNRHLHMSVYCPPKLIGKFRQIYTQTMAVLIPGISNQLLAIAKKKTQGLPVTSYPIDFQLISCGQELAWLRYCDKKQSLQLDNSFVI